MNRPTLRILIVAASDAQALFGSRVLQDHGDSVEVAQDVPDALVRLSRSQFDLALVWLSLPRGDGLALVHHIRALHRDVDVTVVALPSEIEETAHALALGVISSVVLPLTGDGILVAVDRARERRALLHERGRLAAEDAASRRRTAIYARCAAFISEVDGFAISRRLLDVCVSETSAISGAVYLRETGQAESLSRAAVHGDEATAVARLGRDQLPEADPTELVRQDAETLRVVVLGGTDVEALVDLRLPGPDRLPDERRKNLETIASLAASAIAGARKVEAIARTGIKDPQTSAYTFAYFGDVAGREIDRAVRHGRGFSLVTLNLCDSEVEHRWGTDRETRRTLVDAILESVRDSDVLARVEGEEFYLLLPETGLLGALSCRRRILRRLAPLEAQTQGLDPVLGISVFPRDGRDLGKLLRASRRRADASRRGVWRRLGLAGLPFWKAGDRLIGAPEAPSVLSPEMSAQHTVVTTPLMRSIGETIVQDALQRGVAGSVYLAGDPELSRQASIRADEDRGSPVRIWSLDHRSPVEGADRRIRLRVDDPNLGEYTLLLALTELSQYVALGRPHGREQLWVYHSSDLDMVDGLVASLRSEYHLQPEAVR